MRSTDLLLGKLFGYSIVSGGESLPLREAHLGLTPLQSVNKLGNQTALRLAVPRPLKLPLQCVPWTMVLEIPEEV